MNEEHMDTGAGAGPDPSGHRPTSTQAPLQDETEVRGGTGLTAGGGEAEPESPESLPFTYMSARPPPGRPHFSPTASPITNAKMPSNTTTTTMKISNFWREG